MSYSRDMGRMVRTDCVKVWRDTWEMQQGIELVVLRVVQRLEW